MRQIGNYLVEDIPLGSGGMGQVLKGTAMADNRPVAIKEILPNFVSDPEYRGRIESEISFLRKLNNDSIVKVYDHFELNGRLYIVMELVEGQNIEQFVGVNGPIPWTQAVEYLIKVLRAMQHVHELGIVHRDVKPGNIMLRGDGRVCLLDFGVAKDVTSQSAGNGTVIGTVIGTDGYMSPEQAQGMSIDHRTDVYALGCVLYFMITGTHPFSAQSAFEMERDILTKPFPRIADRVRGIPAALQEVLDHAVDKNMMKRYQSCQQFADSLMRILPGGTQMNFAASEPMTVSVGRENCDICVGRDNFKVSRHHADIRLQNFTGGQFFVYTDCSSNGTLIDGQMLRRGMNYNIPRGERPMILLAGDSSCRLDMEEVERAFAARQGGTPQPMAPQPRSPQPRSPQPGMRPDSFDQVAAAPAPGPAPRSPRNPMPPKQPMNPMPPRNPMNPGQPMNMMPPKPPMSFIDAVKTCFMKYVDFNGRASRAEFWWFALFNFLVPTVLTILGFIARINFSVVSTITSLYSLGVFLPSIAVFIRRMHDIGKSGWKEFLLGLIPIFNFFWAIYLIVLCCRPGEPGPNQYGNPT